MALIQARSMTRMPDVYWALTLKLFPVLGIMTR